MFENQFTSKLNAVNTGIKFRDFIENTNVVDLCKKEYCRGTLTNKADLSSLENFRLGIALGDDLPSCQSECSALKANKEITKKEFSKCYSACHKEYNQKGNISGSNELKDYRTKCTKNKEAIKNAAEEYYENKRKEMAQKVTDEKLEEHKTRMQFLIDKKYDKSIEEANVIKKDQERKIDSLTKKTFVETQNVDAEEMKQELLYEIKEIMSPKQKFLNLLDEDNYAVNTTCKVNYCNKQAKEELSTCNSICEGSKDFGIFNNHQEYEKCKTDCQKGKEFKKSECTVRCDDKQEAIKSAAKEYYQEIKNNTSKEKFDASKMEKGFLDKVQEIMENTFPSE